MAKAVKPSTPEKSALDAAHPGPPDAALVLVSHGYENIYERGFCNGLSDAGMPFVLISSDRTDYAGLRPGTKTVNLRGSQEEQRTRWKKLLNLLRYHLRLMTYVVSRRPRVLHLFGLLDPAPLCGVLEGALFRCLCGTYVLTVHDLLPHDRHTRWNAYFYGLSFRMAGRLVAHTELMRDQLVARYGVDADRIVVMQHGIEPRRGVPAAPQCSNSDGRFKILFFGKVLRYKGVDVLLSALENFAVPFHLTIAGGVWDPGLRRELRAQIDAHPQCGSITWEGQFVPEAQIAALFIKADVVVLPYRHIDQSGILFQALRHGAPVVCTRVGALADYVPSEVGEVCAPNDPGDLRRALQRLHDRLGGISRTGIAKRAQQYEWSRTVEPLRRVYGLQPGAEHTVDSGS